MMEEHILGEEPDDTPETPVWQLHDWTVEEVNFVSEYMAHGDLGRAYRQAFKVDRDKQPSRWINAPGTGARWLALPHIRSYVDHLQDALKAKLAVTPENVLRELARLGYANMSEFVVLQEDGAPQFDVSGLTRDQSAAIQEMTIDTYYVGKGEDAREVRSVKVKLAPKIGALELLGKHLKLFTDVVETTDTTNLAEVLRQARRDRQARKQKDEGNGNDQPGDGRRDDGNEDG